MPTVRARVRPCPGKKGMLKVRRQYFEITTSAKARVCVRACARARVGSGCVGDFAKLQQLNEVSGRRKKRIAIATGYKERERNCIFSRLPAGIFQPFCCANPRVCVHRGLGRRPRELPPGRSLLAADLAADFRQTAQTPHPR